jgi:apolipoprotein D and lipocalin family protein
VLEEENYMAARCWYLLPVFGLWIFSGCASLSQEPLPVVQNVDLSRYTGKWYEIARYPTSFQEGCVAVTAEYTLRDDGRIDVVNRCREESLDGPERSIEGVARVVGDETNARLKVTFFWPFEGDYQIIDLDDGYRWAVVGEPSREYLWILSRSSQMDQAVYDSILSRLPEKGYDPARLQITPQPAHVP